MDMGAGMSFKQSSSGKLTPRSTKVFHDQKTIISKLTSELNLKNEEITSLKSKLGVSSNQGPSSGRDVRRRDEISAEVVASNLTSDQINLKVVEKSAEVREVLNVIVNENILFKEIPDLIKPHVVDAFERLDVKAGDFIIKQGDTSADKFYAIEEGQVEVLLKVPQIEETKEEEESIACGKLVSGQSFGELALLYNTPRAASIRALNDCKLWILTRSSYNDIKLHFTLKRREEFLKRIESVDFLAKLNNRERSKLADAMSEEEFKHGEVIIREGELGEHFYIIADGEVEYETNSEGKCGVAKIGEYFGHKALYTDELRQATVTAISDVRCLVLGRRDFVSLLGSLEYIIDRKVNSDDRDDQSAHVQSLKFEELEMVIDGKELILGQGAFGKVLLAKHVSDDGKSFAVKCLSKTEICESMLHKHVLVERQILTIIDHPFISRFHASFWDDKYVYFVVEACLGGELFTLLQKKRRFNEKITKFLSATVLEVFTYLHDIEVVYRDLKPENLMLDDEGYLKVVDFGLAKKIEGKTWTLCGTPDYLAPEIIAMKGHDTSVDFWALGILIFELMTGRAPFAAPDPMVTYEKILKRDVKYPSSFSNGAVTIIKGLLKKTSTKRLGCGVAGSAAVKREIWYSGFNWKTLVKKTMPSPLPVTVKGPLDITNFPYAKGSMGLQHVESSTWEPDFPEQISN